MDTRAWRREEKEDENGEESFCLLHDFYCRPFLRANNPAVPFPNQKPATWQATTKIKKSYRFWQPSSSSSKHTLFLLAKKRDLQGGRKTRNLNNCLLSKSEWSPRWTSQGDAHGEQEPESRINQQKRRAVQNLPLRKQTRPVSWATNFPGDNWTSRLNEANIWNPLTNPSDISNLLCNQRPSRPIFQFL